MIRYITLILSILLLNSCATIVTKSSYNIDITSYPQPAKIQINDSIYNTPNELSIERSKKDLTIKLITDTLTKDFTVKSSLNPSFVFGNLAWMQICPIAYLVDLTNQKRFYYGKSVFLNAYDTTTIIQPLILKNFNYFFSKRYSTTKDQIYLSVGLPWINNFYFQPTKEAIKSNTGFWGISIGFDYFYSNSEFLNISISAISDFFIPIPAAIDITGEYEIMNSLYSSLSNNHRFGRLNFGYGINYSLNEWAFHFNPIDSIKPSRDPITKSTLSIGLVSNVYYQFGKYFYLGLIYRPSLLRTDPNLEFKYEHIISLEFAWKFKLK